MSALFRLDKWISFGDLLPRWANELAIAASNATQLQQELQTLLVWDISDGRVHVAIPWKVFEEIGMFDVRGDRGEYCYGREAWQMLGSMFIGTENFEAASSRALVAKTSLHEFVLMHELALPSFLRQGSGEDTETAQNAHRNEREELTTELRIGENAKIEWDPIPALASLFVESPRLTRDQAKNWLRQLGYDFSARKFPNQIWPRARTRAGLPEGAPAGRPPKSLR